MTERCADGHRVEADHEQGAVGYLAGQLDHARPGRQQIDRRRTSVSELDRRRTERDVLPGKELPQVADRFTHDGHRRGTLPYTPRRNKTGSHGEMYAAWGDFIQAVGKRGEHQRMPHHGA